MKAKLLGAALLAVAVAACGGKASFTVGGTIYGLTNSGLELKNNGGEPLVVPAGATSFSFPNSISYGTEYNVTVTKQPAHMSCDTAGSTGRGAAGHTTSINVVINCTQLSYNLGGTITNLKSSGLTIINGSFGSPLTLAKDATSFTFGAIPSGQTYGLTIYKQPTPLEGEPKQTCTLTEGTGVMGDYERRNVKIECVTL